MMKKFKKSCLAVMLASVASLAVMSPPSADETGRAQVPWIELLDDDVPKLDGKLNAPGVRSPASDASTMGRGLHARARERLEAIDQQRRERPAT